jgi:hypothetical protein
MVIEVHSDYLFPRTESTADEAQDAMGRIVRDGNRASDGEFQNHSIAFFRGISSGDYFSHLSSQVYSVFRQRRLAIALSN